jgi:hypothetical protein
MPDFRPHSPYLGEGLQFHYAYLLGFVLPVFYFRDRL